MPLIPYPDPASLSEINRRLMDALPPGNIIKMLVGAGAAFVPWIQMVNALSCKGSLGNEMRELAMLRTGHLCKTEYELYHHEIIARQIGMSEERINATAAALPSDLFTTAENAALRLIDEVVVTAKGSRAVLEEVRRHFDDRQVLELLLVAGLYRLIGTVTETLEIESGDIEPSPDKRAGLADFQSILDQAR